MSKLITGLVTGGLLLLSLSISAQPVVTITPQNNEVEVGEVFSVDIVVSNFTDVASMQFPIVWDPAVIEPAFDLAPQILPDTVFLSNINNTALPGLNENFFGVDTEQGKLTFLWFEPNFSGITLDDGTRIYTLNFYAKQDGTTDIAISETEAPGIEVTNPSEDEIGLSFQNATAVVGDGIGGGGEPQALMLSLSDHNVQVGETVCVQLTVNDFTDLESLQFGISYDAALLQFSEARAFNGAVTGLDAGAVTNPSAGSLGFQWTDAGSSGVSLPGGSVLLELCFQATGAGTATLQFANSPVNIEAVQKTADNGQQVIDVETDNGNINITSGTGVEGFQLSIADVSVQAGESFCLPVRVNDFQDIVGMQFSIQYNAALLQFDEARNFNASVAGLDANALVNPEAGVIRFSWIDGGFAGIDLADGAILFDLCFQARTAGTATVAFSDTPLPIEITQKVGADDQQVIDQTTQAGTVTITGDGGGGVEGFQLRIDDASVQPGESFCLPVRVNDFQDIVGMQFSIRYDAALLQFDEARNFNASVAGLDANALVNPEAGVIRFSWIDGGFTGIDLADGAILFDLCFQARTAGTAAVSFSDSPLPIEITQKVGADDQQVIDQTTQAGTVTIGSGGGGGGGPGFAGFGLYMEDQVVQSGDQVCLPVKVQDFQDILGMQLSINYDAGALEYVGASSFSLDGLTTSSVNNPTPGNITIQWDDPSVLGQDLADGAVLMELCFNVIADNGVSTVVSFSDTPTPVEFTRTADNDIGQEVIDNYNFRNGRLIIGDGSSTFDGFGFILEDANPQSGEEFCLSLSVQEFTDIVGAQFTIEYDPNALEFLAPPTNFNLEGLGEDAFGNPSPGVITFRWFDPSVAGITLPDGTAIFDLCFRATAQDGTITLVTFSNSPTSIEGIKKVGDTEEPIDDVGFNFGLIEIGSSVPTIVSPVNITNVDCFGSATGAINIEVRGGSAPYTYQWDYQNRVSQDLVGIPAGTYAVTVTDGTGQLTTGTFTVGQPPAALSTDIEVQGVDCAASNAADGSITLSIFGGTPPYNINWSDGLPDGNTIQSNLSPGNYSVTITDANGCVLVEDPIRVLSEGSADVTLNTAFIAPGAPGSINVDITGGDPPFTYQWTGPNGFVSQQQDISGLLRVGEYCLVITDASGCQIERCETIYEVLRFSNVDIQNACADGGNGSISVQMAGGLNPYLYNWSTGANGASLNGVAPGNYGLTVTDAKGDVISGTFEVKALPGITVDASVTPVTGVEGNNNGSIDLSVTGGRPGYTINWSSGATGTQISNLSTGQYCVTISDANSCVVEDCYDVIFQAVPLSFSTETNQPSCSGRSDGELIINVEGGTLPYDVVFGDGTQMSVTNGTLRRTDLPSGRVTFNVRDGANTVLQGEVTIPEADPIRIAEAVVVHDTEAPGCTGSIRLSITGGTPGYTVQWNAPNTGSQIINLCAGPFIPTVVDQEGCVQTFDPIEVTTFGASADITNASCSMDATGSVMLNISGGSAPYTYRWADSSGEVISSNRNLEDVRPGNYQVTISEGSGNDIVKEFAVGATSNISVSAEVLTDFNGFDVSCSDASDAMLRAEASNGIGNYFYEWTRGEEMLGADATLSNVPAGTYMVTAIDQSGCEMTTQVQVQAPSAIAVTATVTDVSCNGEVDGEVSVRASGGAGSNFFDYEWSNGSTSPEIRRLRGGTFTVTVSDAFDCQTVKSFEVVEPDPIVVTIETEPANDGCNGSARAVVTGGTAPYFYKWNAAGADSVLTDICPGNYEVFVTDSRGCESENPKVSAIVPDRRFPCMEASPVITPNGDGDNDLFLINCIEDFPDNQLEVYNRYGQLVFEAENYDNTWDAYAGGQPLPEGPYYFVLQYTDGNGNDQQLKGSLTILHEE